MSFSHTHKGGEKMSPKELLYIEDALGHEKFEKTLCLNTESNLQDESLKQLVQEHINKHEKTFQELYQLL